MNRLVMDIKTYLDKYMSIYHWMKSFVIDELVDKVMEFYSEHLMNLMRYVGNCEFI